MTRPSLTYVDSTILQALISAGPTGDAVRRWFRLSTDTWISSEIALTRMLLALPATTKAAQTSRHCCGQCTPVWPSGPCPCDSSAACRFPTAKHAGPRRP